MLAISPIKIGQYQPTKSINTINTNYPIKNQTKIIGQYSYPAIYFMGSIDKIERPPLKTKTQEKLDTVYKNYKNKLCEISPEEIENTCFEIEKDSNYSRQEILSAMQLITQFGNMDSLKTISKALNKNEIGFIPNNSVDFKAYIYNSPIKNALNNNFGLNASLYYFFNKKEIQNLDGNKIGIFIDNNKMTNLEKLSKEEINDINNRNNIKFFVLSGFENGINFIDKTKNLKQQTIHLLNYAKNNNMPVDEAIDKEIINRCKKIGIKPIIIKNKRNADIETIYNQLKPRQISKKELKAVMDATAINKFEEKNKQIECIDKLTQYLENTLEVYSPERISKELKNIHSKITKQVQTLGKPEENIIYIIPESCKSYDVINYQYQKINNIPQDKFITLKDEESLNKINTKNKVLVILDDCSLSGASLLEDENFNYYTASSHAKQNNTNIIFAPLYVSEEAENRLINAINKRKRNNEDFIIKTNNDEKAWNEGINNIEEEFILNKALGEKSLDKSKYCIVFPYMSPDNNSEFASNIAIFHNINYSPNNNDFTNKFFTLCNIKTFYKEPEKIYHLTNKILKEDLN